MSQPHAFELAKCVLALAQVSGGLLQHSGGNWNDGYHLCGDGWGHRFQRSLYGLQIRSHAPTGSGNWAAGGSQLCGGKDDERYAASQHRWISESQSKISQDLIISFKFQHLRCVIFVRSLLSYWFFISWLGTQALKTQVVGREQVFSIFGDLPRRDAPTANLDLTLGATCTRKALDPCFSSQFFSTFPGIFWCTLCLFVCIDVGNKLTADAAWSFWRLHSTKEIQLPACQAFPPKVWDAEQQPCAVPGFGRKSCRFLIFFDIFCRFPSFRCQFLPRSDVCIPLGQRVRLDPRRVKAELVELPVARELHKEGQKIQFKNLSQ